MTIAYLINQYPKVSHSFIRREIAGLEACGVDVARFSIRSCSSELLDEADKQELEKTQTILGAGATRLLLDALRVAISNPIAFFNALALAVRVGWFSERGLILHLAYLVEACVLLRSSLSLGIKHIHAHFGTNSATVAMLCRELGGPSYSFTVHGPEEFDKAIVLSLDEKIKRSQFVAAVSSYGQSQLYRWCEFDQWPKVQVIRCGVDQDFLDQPFTPISDAPQLICVARLSEQKGHMLLLEAAGRLAAEGMLFKLLLVGDGPLRPHIEAAIARLHLEAHVEIAGWLSGLDVKRQILASRALVLPSFAEGLPVVLMEALALARPVISTYVAGIPELVEPDRSGWLVPPGSVDALVTAMRSALTLPTSTLEQMGKAGAVRVVQQHDAIAEAKKLADLFQLSSEAFPNQSTSKPLTVRYVSASTGNS